MFGVDQFFFCFFLRDCRGVLWVGGGIHSVRSVTRTGRVSGVNRTSERVVAAVSTNMEDFVRTEPVVAL